MATPFAIGLTMTGASSAGAYTAGVLDFLLQALDQWHEAKADRLPPDERGKVPWHGVEISVLSGASAGSICAALFAASLGRPFSPADGETNPEASKNRLYDVWVRKARVESLLENDDLNCGTIITSLLNSDYLARMAEGALTFADPYVKPRYIADPCQILLTTANLRGVGYAIGFSGEVPDAYEMVLHADAQHFYLSPVPVSSLDSARVVRLDPRQCDETWTIDLREAALASSAFPIGFSARLLRRSSQYYVHRLWPIPGGAAPAPTPRPAEFRYATWYAEEPIPPLSPGGDVDAPFAYVAVDGGTMNNEPFELARRVLAGERYRNERGGSEADRAIIMVDPFPSPVHSQASYRAMLDIASVGKALAGAFVQQARFKPDELALAAKADIFSRYLIAPVRRKAGEPVSAPAIASAALAGFGGFLSEAFRRHDYQLGRRNCQRFLERHFALYWDNPVFAGDGPRPEENDGFNFRDDDPETPSGASVRRQRSFRPIVPLVGSARPEVPAPAFPHISLGELEAVESGIALRLDALVRKARAVYARSWPMRAGSWLLWKFERASVVGSVLAKIRRELQEKGLL